MKTVALLALVLLLAVPAALADARPPVHGSPAAVLVRPPIPGKALVIAPTWTSYVRTRAGCLAAFSLGTNLTEGSEVGIVVAGPYSTDVYTVRVAPLDPFSNPTPVTGLRLSGPTTVYEVYARYPNNVLGVQSQHWLTSCAEGIYG